MDFETVGAAEPEYDLRTLPGPGTGPGVELLTAVMRHYQQITGRQLSADRVMAWHLRTALGDALWRSEAGIPLADRTACPLRKRRPSTPTCWPSSAANRKHPLTASTPPRSALITEPAAGQRRRTVAAGRWHVA